MTGAARSSMRTMRERTKEQMSSLSSSFDFRQPNERRKIERALIDYSPSFFLSDLFFEIVLLFVTSEELKIFFSTFSFDIRSPNKKQQLLWKNCKISGLQIKKEINLCEKTEYSEMLTGKPQTQETKNKKSKSMLDVWNTKKTQIIFLLLTILRENQKY